MSAGKKGRNQKGNKGDRNYQQSRLGERGDSGRPPNVRPSGTTQTARRKAGAMTIQLPVRAATA
jgi:hypothetical protein